MELAIPLVALGGLYIVSKNKNRPTNVEPSQENFQGIGAGKQTNELPNTNLPNKNYPEESPVNPTLKKSTYLPNYRLHTSTMVNPYTLINISVKILIENLRVKHLQV